VASLVIFAAGNLLTLMSTNLAGYLVSRTIAGIGAGMFSPVAAAAAARLVAPEARGRAMSLIWGANSAGAVVGVPAGLWLSHTVGWQAAIWAILGLAVVALVGVALRQPNFEAGDAPPTLSERLRFMVDRRVLSTIGVTGLTAAGSLGLYAFVAPLQAGLANSAEAALTLWNVGGLIGSSFVGYVVDKTGNPRAVMAAILASLAVAVFALPTLGAVPVLGLLPFLLWGILGWATGAPQQLSLLELEPRHHASVVALNGSALGLGSVVCPALGGLALTCGLDVHKLPYAACGLLLCALVWQVLLLQQQPREEQAA
jgi:predicted MFS family arabinose efflux permease